MKWGYIIDDFEIGKYMRKVKKVRIKKGSMFLKRICVLVLIVSFCCNLLFSGDIFSVYASTVETGVLQGGLTITTSKNNKHEYLSASILGKKIKYEGKADRYYPYYSLCFFKILQAGSGGTNTTVKPIVQDYRAMNSNNYSYTGEITIPSDLEDGLYELGMFYQTNKESIELSTWANVFFIVYVKDGSLTFIDTKVNDINKGILSELDQKDPQNYLDIKGLTEEQKSKIKKKAEELTSDEKSDYERAYRIYEWLQDNCYVIQGTSSYTYEPYHTFETMIGNRSNIADLADVMCKSIGIPSVVLKGDSKYPYILDYVEGTTSRWNAIYADNRWLYMDCAHFASNRYINGEKNETNIKYHAMFDPDIDYFSITHIGEKITENSGGNTEQERVPESELRPNLYLDSKIDKEVYAEKGKELSIQFKLSNEINPAYTYEDEDLEKCKAQNIHIKIKLSDGLSFEKNKSLTSQEYTVTELLAKQNVSRDEKIYIQNDSLDQYIIEYVITADNIKNEYKKTYTIKNTNSDKITPFIWGKDNPRFLNQQNDFFNNVESLFPQYKLSKDNIKKLSINYGVPEKDIADAYIHLHPFDKSKDTVWRGSCYGMVLGTVLLKKGLIKPSEIEETKNSFYEMSFPKDNNNVRDFINYYQLSCNFRYKGQNKEVGWSEYEDEELSKAITLKNIVELLSHKEMIGIHYGWLDSDNKGAAHEILLYREESDFDTKDTNAEKQNGHWFCYGYNPNCSRESDFRMVIDVENGVYRDFHVEYRNKEGEFEPMDSVNRYCVLKYFTFADIQDEMKHINYTKEATPPLDYTPVKNDYITVAANGNFTITNEAGKKIQYKDGTWKDEIGIKSKRMIVGDSNSATADYILEVPQEDVYTFQSFASETNITISDRQGKLSTVTAAGASEIKIDQNKGISVIGNNLDYRIGVSSDKDRWTLLDGKADNKVSATLDEKGVYLESDKTGIVTGFNFYKEEEEVISQNINGEKVLIENNLNKTSDRAKQDKNSWELLKLTNKYRLNHNLSVLSTFTSIQSAVNKRAEELDDLYSHDRPDGTECFTVFDQYNINYTNVAENIAMGQTTPDQVFNSWINSEGHRANILESKSTHMANGYFTNKNQNYWAQLFSGTCKLSSYELEKPKTNVVLEKSKIDDWNLVITAHCQDHGISQIPVVSEMCSGYDSTKVGQQKIHIRCGEYETDYTINVISKTKLTGISIQEPNKKEYTIGETLDTSGMKVTANYSDGSSKDVTKEVKITGYDKNKNGAQQISISFEGKTVYFSVEVKKQEVDFWYTKGSQSVSIIGFKGNGSVADVPEMIEGLPVVNLGNDDYEPFDIRDGFFGDKQYQIKKIIIPSTVRWITEHAFLGHKGIEEIVVKDGADFGLKNTSDKIVVDQYVVDSLKKISLGNAMTDISKDIFYGDQLETINISEGNPKYSSKDGVLYNNDKTELIICGSANPTKEIHLPNTVKKISDFAFQNCNKIEKIYIPKSVESLGSNVFSMSSAKIIVEKGSWIHKYFKENGYKYYFPDGTTDMPESDIIEETPKPMKVSKISISAKSKKVAAGNKITLTATVSPSNATNKKVTWKSSNTSYATVDQKGVVAAKSNAAGKTVTITATAKDGSGIKGTYQLSIYGVSRISLSGISKNIAAGKKITLKPTVSPKDVVNKKLKWSSSNTKIAVVNQAGVVTVKKNAGNKSVTITAAAQDGSNKKATYKIKVMKGVVKTISVSGKKTVKAGKSLKLKAKVTASKGANKKLKWSSRNTKYATVSSSGSVKALKAGKGKSVKITAMATDGSGKKKTVTIKIQ